MSHAHIADILSLKNTRIFIVGDIILDKYIEGKVSRISPEAPVPVVLEHGQKVVPGGASNVAANVASMGAGAFLCGRIGTDQEAYELIQVLQSWDVHLPYLIHSPLVPTITKTRVISGHLHGPGAQQIVRVDREVNSPLTGEQAALCLSFFDDFMCGGGAMALVISDYGKGFLSSDLVAALIQKAKKHHIPIVTDPKSDDVGRYAGSTVIKPNLAEGRSVYQRFHSGRYFTHFTDEVEAIAETFLSHSQCQNLVMSLSEHGVLLMGESLPQKLYFPSRALQVADVSGAGDTLVAFLAMGIAAHIPLNHATEMANVAAGIVCSKQGTATVESAVFLHALKQQTPNIYSQEKRISKAQATRIMADYKKQSQKVVFTNGCFDILHAGHVDYLEKAKALGDILVVGMNSDDSVRRLKGNGRPVNPFADRSHVLSALESVDFIVEFTEDTPLDLILLLEPSVLVKGADYTIENTVGAKEVLSWGGAVKHIELLSGRSTSSILQKLF